MNRKYCLDKKEWEEAQAALLLAKQFGLIEDAGIEALEEKRAFYENNQDLFGRYHGDLFDYEDVRQIIEKRLREDAYDRLIQDILCQSENRA